MNVNILLASIFLSLSTFTYSLDFRVLSAEFCKTDEETGEEFCDELDPEEIMEILNDDSDSAVDSNIVCVAE